LCGKSRFDIMPSRGEIRVPGRQRPDAMQVIGQNDHGLDSERSTLTGRLENRPKIVIPSCNQKVIIGSRWL
jgi:hypothetical protein